MVYVLFVLLGSLALHSNRLYSSSLAFDLNNDILKYECGVLPGGEGRGANLSIAHPLPYCTFCTDAPPHPSGTFNPYAQIPSLEEKWEILWASCISWGRWMAVESRSGQLTQFPNTQGQSRSKLITTHRLTPTAVFIFLAESPWGS